MSEKIPDVHAIKMAPNVELEDVVQEAKDQLNLHPVIIIPKGIINPKSLHLSVNNLRTMELTEDGFGAAAPHDHEEPSCLVSLDRSVETPTLIFNAQAAVRATLELLKGGWKEKIEAKIAQLPESWDYAQKFKSAIVDLEKHGSNPSLGIRNIHERPDERRSLGRIRMIISNTARSAPDAFPVIYEFISETQKRIASSTRVIEWPDTDLVMFHGDMIHGRDVTKRPNRLSTENLYMVLSNVRRRGSH